ncbi:hypothetical protein HHI36_014612, partial [Cryptolaemus montrouzieri]
MFLKDPLNGSLLTDFQHGYLKNRSTETASVKMIDSVCKEIDKKMNIMFKYKFFDAVPGLPGGLVLGPLQFLDYNNDLFKSVNPTK